MALNGSFFVIQVRVFALQKFLQRLDLFDLFPGVLSFYHNLKCVLTQYCETLILWPLLNEKKVLIFKQSFCPCRVAPQMPRAGCLRGLVFSRN